LIVAFLYYLLNFIIGVGAICLQPPILLLGDYPPLGYQLLIATVEAVYYHRLLGASAIRLGGVI
jgi:hypothetical protein